MTLLILRIAALKISELSGPEMAEVCLPRVHREDHRIAEPLSSDGLAGDHENFECFFHNRDTATPNLPVKLPRPGFGPRLKPLGRTVPARRHAGRSLLPPGVSRSGRRAALP